MRNNFLNFFYNKEHQDKIRQVIEKNILVIYKVNKGFIIIYNIKSTYSNRQEQDNNLQRKWTEYINK